MRLSELRFECREVKSEVHAAAVEIRKGLVELVGSRRCRLWFGLSRRTPGAPKIWRSRPGGW